MTEAKREIPRKVKIIGYGILILFPLFVVAVLEISGKIYLKSHEEQTYPLFLRGNSGQEAENEVFDTRTSLSSLDPTLSHSHGPNAFSDQESIPGFVIYGSEIESPKYRIVALGGSTTDPITSENWVKSLSDLLKENNIPAHVYNGGVSGYSSNQELLKFIRDVLPLEPDIVVSLSGINDLGWLHSVPGHPMIHPYQNRVFKSITKQSVETSRFLPNLVASIKLMIQSPEGSEIGMNLGPIVRTTPAEQWIRNERLVHAAAQEMGVDFVCFLQPVMGVGSYTPTAKEQEMLDKAIKSYEWRGDYLKIVNEFYDKTTSSMQTMPYCVEITDIFADKQGMYRDARHQTAEGAQVLAQTIFEELKNRKLIDVE